MSEFIQIVTTTVTQDEALRIARALVEQRLAACVQVSGPITSVYRWEGQIETSTEWVCTIKTRDALRPDVAQVIRQLHSYQVPEIVALPILAGNASYLEWIRRETET